MPAFCAVVQCSSRGGIKEKYSFFRIPSIKDRSGKVTKICTKRRELWINAIKRADLTEKKLKYAMVCSRHFISGKPASLYDQTNPDWVPSINMGYNTTKDNLSYKSMQRFKRTEQRANTSKKQLTEMVISIEEEEIKGIEEREITEVVDKDEIIKNLQQKLDNLTLSLSKVQTKLQKLSHNFESYQGNNDKTRFYTGLESFEILNKVYKFIESYLIVTKRNMLQKDEQLILTLMKLRHNFLFTDLAYKFNINRRTASRIFYRCLHILYYRLKWLVYWPKREELRSCIPLCFKEAFGNKVTTIIDCFEVFTEKSGNVNAQSQMFSHYKHHQTVKFLIGISPQGTIMYISQAYGGRASDKHITETSGFINNLLPGDLVLADRGFLISEVIGSRLAQVKTPAFLKGHSQMPPKDLEMSRKLSRVRVHVERVIGCLQQKYTILNKFISMDIIKYVYDDNVPALDKIVTVSSALVNLCPSINVPHTSCD